MPIIVGHAYTYSRHIDGRCLVFPREFFLAKV